MRADESVVGAAKVIELEGIRAIVMLEGGKAGGNGSVGVGDGAEDVGGVELNVG